MHPKILYWKWDDSILDREIFTKKLKDIVNRCGFDVIAVSPHDIQNIDLSITSPEFKTCVKFASDFLAQYGRKLVLEIDVGQYAEFGRVFSKAPDKFMHLARLYDAMLDENGCATIDVIPTNAIKAQFTTIRIYKKAIGIYGAWVVTPTDDMTFADGSEIPAKDFCKLVDSDDKQQIIIDAGKQNAGKQIVLYTDVLLDNPDKMSDEYRQSEVELIEEMSDMGISGVTVDEWGIRPTTENGTIPNLYISEEMRKCYFEHCGRDLYQDLLYFYHTPNNNKGISYLVVNKYIETIRKRMTEDDAIIYDTTKRVLGRDAFVGFHPTWYCAPDGFAVESVYNGMDWWQVKRDYSQTDERVMIPIRLAMARGAKKPIWYNMWYSQRTLDIKTYFRETWVNARFGGRTTYLGYECNEPGVVLNLYQEGLLESVSEMEEVATKINDFQASLPDSRVLCLFGMEYFTNWQITDHGCKLVNPKMKGHKDILAFANKLFANNILFDLVPTSEVDRGTLRIEKGKIKYHNHDYDAIVTVGIEGTSQKAVDFIRSCKEVTNNIIMVGDCKLINDGSECAETFDFIGNKYPMDADTSEIARLILSWGVAANMTSNSAVFEDGSVVFTTDGAKNIGNPLEVDFYLEGKHVVFKGTDILAIKIKDGKLDYRFGTASEFTVDGASLINNQ